MSFLNKMKSWGPDRNAAGGADAQENPFDDAYSTHRATVPSLDGTATLDMGATGAHRADAEDSSIISEASPSEMAEFSETRIQGMEVAVRPAAHGDAFQRRQAQPVDRDGLRPGEQCGRRIGRKRRRLATGGSGSKGVKTMRRI